MYLFQKEFEKSQNAPIVVNGVTYYRTFEINIGNCTRIHIEAESIRAKKGWRQAVHISSDGTLACGNDKGNDFVYWFSTGGWFSESAMKAEYIAQTNSTIRIWNVWQVDNAIQSLYNGAAMLVTKFSENQWRFECNDGEPNCDMDDLVFILELR